MARMNSKVRREFDAASAVTLRAVTDGAETADANEAGIALNVLTGAYWDNSDQPNGDIRVSIHVTAIDRTTGDETYDLYFEVDNSNAFSSAKEVARITGITETGYYEVVIPQVLVEKFEVGATHLRARLDVGGTTPSITYGAWATYCCD